jgi:hypothetical protein
VAQAQDLFNGNAKGKEMMGFDAGEGMRREEIRTMIWMGTESHLMIKAH